jgi:hypothetical protein
MRSECELETLGIRSHLLVVLGALRATNALHCHEPPANHICSIQHILCKKME